MTAESDYICRLQGRISQLELENTSKAKRMAELQSLNEDLMANCNQLRDRCWKAEEQLARWQKIAIDERCKIIYHYFGNNIMK